MASAQIMRVNSMAAPVIGGPTITPSTGALSAFSTSTGTASAAQSFTVLGASLTGAGTASAPTGYEISLDSSAYFGSLNLPVNSGAFTGQPVKIYTRLAAADGIGSYPGFVSIASPGAITQNVTVNGTVSTAVGLDSLRFNFFALNASGSQQSGWLNIPDPSQRVTTLTGGNSNSITLTTVATGNWSTFGDSCTFPGNGGGGTFLSYAPNVGKDLVFTGSFGTFNLSFPQLRFSGLLPGHHYALDVYSSYTFSTSPNNIGLTDYRAYDGTTTYGPVSFDGQASNLHGNYKSGTQTLPGLMCDGSGILLVYISLHAGSDLTTTACGKLRQTD